jgi:hypothetical protein
MKRIAFTMLAVALTMAGFAQQDSVPNTRRDTIRVGGLIIITKKDKNNKAKDVEIKDGDDKDNDNKGVSWKRKKRKPSNVSTNWFSWDLGFNNYKDETNYAGADVAQQLRPSGSRTAPGPADFKLNTGKSVNVNIWIFTQKMNLVKHVLNLKYGLGIELHDYRYKSPLSFKDEVPPYIIKDSISFSKNKLKVKYISAPLMLTINPSGRGGFSISGGVSVGYRYGALNKQISGERGKKKERGDFGLNPWKLAAVGDIGWGPFRLYGSYSLTPLFEKGLNLTPYTIGLRFSNW